MSVFDQLRLDGKRAMVTAASRGLGREIARGLAQAGADLVLISQNQANLEKAREDIAAETGRKIDILTADFYQPREVERACRTVLDQYGPIDILVNNAGGRRESIPLFDYTIDEWQRHLNLNLNSAVLCTQIIGKPMVERKWGRIINIGSISAMISLPGIAGRHYETAKAALHTFTRCVAADWAPYGVTVNAIAPGGFMTDANRRWFRERPELQKEIEAKIPMGRLGEPEEITALAVYLASEASRYMTGSIVVIDGGRTIW